MNAKDDNQGAATKIAGENSGFGLEHEDSGLKFARRSLLTWAIPVGVAIGLGSVAKSA